MCHIHYSYVNFFLHVHTADICENRMAKLTPFIDDEVLGLYDYPLSKEHFNPVLSSHKAFQILFTW